MVLGLLLPSLDLMGIIHSATAGLVKAVPGFSRGRIPNAGKSNEALSSLQLSSLSGNGQVTKKKLEYRLVSQAE
ncbi:hypothetical protein GALMADRAFT_937059 [Galerina marginata CBS 339.88]|uniref:Uncharacterized protein n=1 Tax=Galerina marginata (strain CBS 339.88) TaxID=685588 RepID=A0A067SQB5_GALM3|nr:hypothetical protein GALMADRAFT_937059 [Galerina marginata CBS 339.88]